MNDITNVQGESGIVLNGATPSPSSEKVKRIKHELKINPEFLKAIDYLKKRNGIKTTSKVIEKIFKKESFNYNELGESIAKYNNAMANAHTQISEIYNYCIDLATVKKSPQQIASVKKYYEFIKAKNHEDGRVQFDNDFSDLLKELENLIKRSAQYEIDDSEEIENIRRIFSSDIDSNLPERNNICFRLDYDLERKFFPANRPKIGDSQFRRVLHNVLMKNTEILVERASYGTIEHIRKQTDYLNDKLKSLNTTKLKKDPINLHEFYLVILKIKKELVTYNK
ncbi:hypothetical protein ACCE15_19165 [Pseudomonas parafulva]|uniref:hypothetical protein n=1 Tax=Pseudomonas parafulva TaxID=157782 RepID=UPI003565CC07